jgi:3-hydroxyisobutyrate dehydrogenase-like beta-hydroxyacid dehydrogenase
MEALRVGIIGTGAMGSAVAKRLIEGGCSVVTSLEGRSQASRARVATLDIPVVETTRELASRSDLVLSIVPPGEARAAAETFAAALRADGKVPATTTYIDCNAIAPATALEVETIVRASGAAFVDAGIIGGPPRSGTSGPIFFVSGPDTKAALQLTGAGLDMRALDDTIGSASAIKLSYAGVTKGLTTLYALMLQHAREHAVGDGLNAVLEETLPGVWPFLESMLPAMYPKAYRFVAEMREIAKYTAPDDAGEHIYEGAARFYERVASEVAATPL